MTDRILRPGDTIGILGGGQLARMLAMAAAEFGLKCHIYAPPGDNPAFDVAARHTEAAYTDAEALARFASDVIVVTYEFENVPAETVAAIAPHALVRPNGTALAKTQDRLVEKTFLRDLGLPTAPFAPVDDAGGLEAAVAALGLPSILKTRRFGYDGKGQIVLRAGADLPAAARDIGGPAILEGFVRFDREVSVVAARGVDGAFRAFDLCENRHADGILAMTQVPATVLPGTEDQAVAMARRIADALDYVGVVAVEMFVVPDNGAETLVVNEIAPRVHNSGHWTSDGALTSQFAQHIRAICGWPLGSVERLGTVTMRNLVGSDADGWLQPLAEPGACLHLYGKAEARPGRKMGHVTVVRPTPCG